MKRIEGIGKGQEMRHFSYIPQSKQWQKKFKMETLRPFLKKALLSTFHICYATNVSFHDHFHTVFSLVEFSIFSIFNHRIDELSILFI